MTLVLGATTFLYWLSDADLTAPSSIALYGIIAVTYALTIVYSVSLKGTEVAPWLPRAQLGGDLLVASLLVHVTGGAQSAYTFFFPLAIIGAALVASRRTAAAVALAATVLFLLVGVLGWLGVLPALPGQRFSPTGLSGIELARSLGLNLAGIVGVSVLALSLSRQLQVTSASLEVERTVAADLLTLHSDIVRCLSSGLITIDPTNNVSTINQAACDILGVEPDISGQPIGEVLPGLPDQLRSLTQDSALARGELAAAHRDGSKLVLGISVSPLFDHHGKFLGRVINFQDLTELRRMESNVRRAERLAMVGKLAAGVAHEIRNPLASISGSVELLRQMPQADDDSRTLMGIVNREIDRLNGLLTDLLDYANPRPIKIAPVDMAELVHDTVRVFQQDRDFESVSVDLDIDAQASEPLAGDAAKLRQVVWNLLRNAAEAASKGGGHVSVAVKADDGGIILSVCDDGPGISEPDKRRVFEPFFTTKSKGTGLGLATVHGLVTDHRGTIDFDSDIGRGTCFTVTLPYTAGRGRTSSPPPQGDSNEADQ